VDGASKRRYGDEAQQSSQAKIVLRGVRERDACLNDDLVKKHDRRNVGKTQLDREKYRVS
jgi:hypothetical protein